MLDTIFHLKEHGTTWKKEVFAGLTSFATLAYAVLLIPSILSHAGMDFGAVMSATLLTGAYASILMGFLANYPFVLAPGIALTVYFAHSVVLGAGHTWQEALGVVFLCGVTFVLLNLLRIRQLVIEAIPRALRIGTMGGLGFLLALVALKEAKILLPHPNTLITFGNVKDSSVFMTFLGLFIISSLLVLRVKGAIFLGILSTWTIGLIFKWVSWQGFFGWPDSLMPTLFALDVRGVFTGELVSVFLSFLFVSLFDTSGTLVALAEEGQFLSADECKKRCHFPRLTCALIPDATGSVLGGILGTSTTSVYLESAAGIEMGGRTGLSAISCGCCFLLALFFAPFASSIPLFATAPALIIVGALMLRSLVKLDWKDPSEWLPSFLTLLLIPLTFNIATGIGVGFIFYVLLKLVIGRVKEVHWIAYIIAALFVAKFLFLPEA